MEFPNAWGGKISMPPVVGVQIFSGTTHFTLAKNLFYVYSIRRIHILIPWLVLEYMAIHLIDHDSEKMLHQGGKGFILSAIILFTKL